MASVLPTAKIVFLDVEIDMAQETVRRGAEEYRLRQKTFQVLLYLVRHRDRVVTREELFASVWNDAAVTEDTLVQCVVEIRKALGDDPRSPRFVRTIPKRGYVFIAAPAHDLAPAASTVTIQVETTRSMEYEVVSDTVRSAASRLLPWVGGAVVASAVLVLATFTISRLGNARETPPAAQLRPAGESFGASLTSSPEAYRLFTLGVERANELRTREAVDLLERAISIDPEFAMAHARVGYARGVIDGDSSAARPYLTRAMRLGHRLSEKDRMTVEAWQAIIDSDYADAIERFRAIVDRYPMDLESHWRLGTLLNGEERTEEAAAILERAVLIDPRSAHVHNLLGGLYSFLGRHEESIASRLQYVRITDEPNAWDSLGLSYNWAGRYEEALAAYERALSLKSDFDIARYHRAATLVQLGRFADAISDVESAPARAVNERERSRAYATMADIHRLKGDEGAARDMGRRVDLNSGWSGLLDAIDDPVRQSPEALGRMLAAFNDRGARPNRRLEFQVRGHRALRRSEAKAAIQLFRDSLRFRALNWYVDPLETGLADAYLQLRHFREARDEYTRVLSLNPNYAAALHGRARAHEALGQTSEARADYERFLKLWNRADPDARDLVEAKKRVARLR